LTGEEARADRLVSELSHELHTPLALIVGYAELLQIRTDEVTRRDAPTRILEAAERLAAAMDTLLVVLALDAGWLSVEPTPVNLETALAGPAGLPVRSVLDAYIARMLVELHGGAISAEAVAGKGLRIVFTLPLAPEASR